MNFIMQKLFIVYALFLKKIYSAMTYTLIWFALCNAYTIYLAEPSEVNACRLSSSRTFHIDTAGMELQTFGLKLQCPNHSTTCFTMESFYYIVTLNCIITCIFIVYCYCY